MKLSFKTAETGMEIGKEIELEHTQDNDLQKAYERGANDTDIAEIIAEDHLNEYKDYYDPEIGLPAMEDKLKKEKASLLSMRKQGVAASFESVLVNELKFTLFDILKSLDKIPVLPETEQIPITIKGMVKNTVLDNLQRFNKIFNKIFGEDTNE